MAKELPCYILRDCMLFVNRNIKIGQVAEFALPALEAKREDMRNAGMIKPRKIYMGYEAVELSFKMPGLDPEIIKLCGLAIGVEVPIMGTGALVDEDGEGHSAVLSMRARFYKFNPGTWKGGDVPENEYSVDVNWFKLEVDGEELLEVDDFDVKTGGQSQNQSIRNLLLL